jgi:hypothetical protein
MGLATCILHTVYGIGTKCASQVMVLWKVETLVYKKIKGIKFLLLQLPHGRVEGWVPCVIGCFIKTMSAFVIFVGLLMKPLLLPTLLLFLVLETCVTSSYVQRERQMSSIN